ncbi:uncharacterized protein LOC144143233 [Haemaphysalis longicornis]
MENQLHVLAEELVEAYHQLLDLLGMLPIMSWVAHMSQEVLLCDGAIFAKLQSTRPVPVFLDTAKAVPEEVGTLIIIHNRPSRNLPEPDECWDGDAEDWENWRPPAKEPTFRPVPIGARPADHRGYYDALNATLRPPRPFRVLQPSAASTGPQETSARSTLEAAADKRATLEHPPRPSLSCGAEGAPAA